MIKNNQKPTKLKDSWCFHIHTPGINTIIIIIINNNNIFFFKDRIYQLLTIPEMSQNIHECEMWENELKKILKNYNIKKEARSIVKKQKKKKDSIFEEVDREISNIKINIKSSSTFPSMKSSNSMRSIIKTDSNKKKIKKSLSWTDEKIQSSLIGIIF